MHNSNTQMVNNVRIINANVQVIVNVQMAIIAIRIYADVADQNCCLKKIISFSYNKIENLSHLISLMASFLKPN